MSDVLLWTPTIISDVLLWTPTYGRAKAGRPARTYIQQLCEDTGCSLEDLPEAMNDRDKWQERGQGISVPVARHDDIAAVYGCHLTSLISSLIVLMMVHLNRNATESTLLLNKSLLPLGFPWYQFYFMYCRMTLHYLLIYIYNASKETKDFILNEN